MDKNKAKQQKNIRRHVRVRSKIAGTEACPRLSVFRSNKGMFLQLIDDVSQKTLVSANQTEIKKKAVKVELGKELGLLIAKKASALKITKVVFDRSAYKYHGRVKAVAEGARAGGLEF
jgi:large subunit ribosomal protein L18